MKGEEKHKGRKENDDHIQVFSFLTNQIFVGNYLLKWMENPEWFGKVDKNQSVLSTTV